MDERNDDLFDDLFEPFELDDGPPAPGEEPPAPPEPTPPPAEEAPVPMVNCPSCGTGNPAHNMHCEACGARISTDPLPVAPAPMARSSAGMRALLVLIAILLIVAVGALVINLSGNGDDEAATSTSTSTTTTTEAVFQLLVPTDVEASSELGQSFSAENLLDDDPETEWQDAGLRGSGASLTFTFAQPVKIVSIEIVNLPDADRYRRNYRIKDFVIEVDDLSIDIPGSLDDANEPQRIQIGTVGTTQLTLEVRTTYPAESVGDLPPFLELAVADIRFFGTPGG